MSLSMYIIKIDITYHVLSFLQYNKERPDNHSDTSGETIQSDSGVGISEGETRSTMSHSHHTGTVN